MAKAKEAEGVNRSKAIREAIEASPKASAKEIVEALKAKGIETNEGLFYQVRRKMGGKKKPKAAKVPATKKTAPANGRDVLLELNALAAKAGGIEELEKAVSILKEIKG